MRLLIGMLMGGLVAAQAPAGPLVFGPQAAWFRPADAEESHAPSRPTADDLVLERREGTWTGAVEGGVGCGDAVSSNPDIAPQR